VKRFAAAVGITFGLVGYARYLILDLTRKNLEALSRVPPLSWDAVCLVYACAFDFTAIVVLLLIAIAVVLWLAETGRSTTTPSSAAPPPS
jgi:putative exporter of polyketide antibiotics